MMNRLVSAYTFFFLTCVVVFVPFNQASALCSSSFFAQTQPLNDLGTNEYRRLTSLTPPTFVSTGFIGGLYPGGSNQRPAAHHAQGLLLANQIQRLDASGNPSANGKIGMTSIGMSNTQTEFGTFLSAAANDPAINDNLVIINGALSGGTVERWIDPANTAYWDNLNQKISQAGLTDNQVQVVWLKITRLENSSNFPYYLQNFETDLKTLTVLLKQKFPNLKITYISSRTRSYAFAKAAVAEPAAFENAFAVRWLIEKQINGDPTLNFDPNLGPAPVSYFSWGPYLWIDGMNPRSDGRIWPATNLENDCVHPSAQGNQDVASMLMQFFKTDATATPWFLNTPPSNQAPTVNAGADISIFLSETANLNANVVDDGLPSDAAVTSSWLLTSGPGTATISSPSSPATSVTFDTPGVYELTITANDTLLQSSDSILITVQNDPVNEPPVAQNGSYSTPNDTELVITLPFTDPGDNDPHEFNIESNPSYGVISESSGVVTYTPDGTYVGDVTFTWTVSDGEFTSNTATATITLESSQTEQGLISHFRFASSGPLYDEIATCTGCSVNGATWVSGGVSNGAYSYDGINDYLNLGAYNHLEGKNAFTVSTWIKPTFDETSTTSYYLYNDNNQVRMFYLGSINDWRIGVKVVGGSETIIDTTGLTWIPNEWHLITLTYEGSSLKLYWDGVLKNTKTTSGAAVNSSTGSVYIGAAFPGTQHFSGYIDEFKLYDRALTVSEILTQFNNP